MAAVAASIRGCIAQCVVCAAPRFTAKMNSSKTNSPTVLATLKACTRSRNSLPVVVRGESDAIALGGQRRRPGVDCRILAHRHVLVRAQGRVNALRDSVDKRVARRIHREGKPRVGDRNLCPARCAEADAHDDLGHHGTRFTDWNCSTIEGECPPKKRQSAGIRAQQANAVQTRMNGAAGL
jgi:hypothetical protein